MDGFLSSGALGPELIAALGIALLRVADVAAQTFKVSFISQGRRWPATLASSVEAALWLAAAGVVFADLSVWRAGGFVVGVTSGTWVGMEIVHRLRLGLATVRAFVPVGGDRAGRGEAVVKMLHEHGHGATLMRDALGRDGPAQVILSVVRRRDAAEVCDLIHDADERAFVTIDNSPGPRSLVGGVPGGRV